MTDEELLALVRDERPRSIGFDHDSELSAARERALEYYRGVMNDVPSLPNRSGAVSTDVSDAIDTILPDLVEIFTGGDDVATFIPRGQEDEEPAQQETDYVNHVIFNENDGWMVLYSMFKDALQVKTGVVKFWAEECPGTVEEIKGRSAVAVQMAAQDGEIVELSPVKAESDGDTDPDQEPLYDFKVKREAYKRVRIAAVPPEDFTVAGDTVKLADATYCAMRSRPRAQDLIADGYAQEDVDKLSAYGRINDDAVATARDTVNENEHAAGGLNSLRRVEIVEHVIRVADADGSTLYSVVTGQNESILLRKPEKIGAIPFAAITPHIVTHRFYGESVADRVMDFQKINTALTRMALDSGYFALNQRNEVAEDGCTANTIADLLRNEPGVPVRVRRSGTVAPITAGQLGFDVFGALEHFQTRVEQRTGIVRAAQGMNPDTLHDTAKGALALLSAAQKRVRLIARIFAETGVKDLFLGVHGLLREYGGKKGAVRLRNKWVEVDPTSWGERADMSIEVGMGASGKDAEIAALMKEAEIMQSIVTMQGGANGPIVGQKQAYEMAKRIFEKLGNKSPEKYLIDPAENPQPQQGPAPDPKMMEAQANAQLEQQKAAAAHDLEQQKAASSMQLEQQKMQLQSETDRQKHASELQMKGQIAQAELEMKRELMQAELQMKREEMAMRAAMHQQSVSAGIESQVHVGGNPG